MLQQQNIYDKSKYKSRTPTPILSHLDIRREK